MLVRMDKFVYPNLNPLKHDGFVGLTGSTVTGVMSYF